MSTGTICDQCSKVYRKEGEFCENEEVKFELKRYHLGNGMDSPTGELEVSFCSLKCFKEWFDEKYQDDFKEVSKI